MEFWSTIVSTIVGGLIVVGAEWLRLRSSAASERDRLKAAAVASSEGERIRGLLDLQDALQDLQNLTAVLVVTTFHPPIVGKGSVPFAVPGDAQTVQPGTGARVPGTRC